MANDQIWLCMLQLILHLCIFDNLTDALVVHISQDWITYEQVLPISLQMFDFSSKLVEVPEALKDFVYQYKPKKEMLDKCDN